MPHRDLAATPRFVDLFTPKLVTVMREGYRLSHLRNDFVAGLTVAIVALPLSMAIAIASGTGPERGLFTSIVGGFLTSALGGSRFQIGGPAGAFIVLVAASVDRHGIDGVFLACILAGLMLMAIGFLRLGTYIKFIPYPVTVGFTAGIATIIAASQLKDLFGLHLAGKEPGALIPKLAALFDAAGTASPVTIGLAMMTIAIIAAIRRLRPTWPAFLIAVVAAALVTFLFGLPVETIGSHFGGIPRMLPAPHLPPVSLSKIQEVFPDAMAFALLGAIESLLSAVVADGMTGRRHRSNCELVAQGVANIACGFFGGICATGTIARTATNVRAGAHGPVAGILHAVILLVFMLVAAPLASYIPLTALAAVLVVVSWNMAERHAVTILVRSSGGDAVVLLATYFLTIFRDLTEGIATGFVLGAVLFINRMARMASVAPGRPLLPEDQADEVENGWPYDETLATDRDIAVYHLSGAFFFGAASTIGSSLESIADRHKALILDFADVPFIDSTAANTILMVARKAQRAGVALFVTGTTPEMRKNLAVHHVGPPLVHFERSVTHARRSFAARQRAAEPAPVAKAAE